MIPRKSPTLFAVIVGVWVLLVALAAIAFFADPGVRSAPLPVLIVLLINCICFAFFWLVGIKDLGFVGFFAAHRGRLGRAAAAAAHPPVDPGADGTTDPIPGLLDPRVLLLYCTADDFDEHSLRASMRQGASQHPSRHLSVHPDQDHDPSGCEIDVVILDDSLRTEFTQRVDAFAAEHGLRVVRRSGRAGFKAGNLNNYLRGRDDYDYVVLLDSDEIIPPDFVTQALQYFRDHPHAGIVQGNHTATRPRNRFMTLLGSGVQPQVQTFQTMKQRYGFAHLMGHGAMISRECYQDCGGFPELVMEDLAFSIEARIRGYQTVFAPDILCEEEYPVDYLAFKKRHAKWTEGTIEFIRSYSWRILRSRMAWYEKLDIVLSVYALPLAAVFGFLLLLTNLLFLPLFGYAPGYPHWLVVPSLISLLAPLANDIVHLIRTSRQRDLIPYIVHSFLVYSSTFYLTLAMTIRAVAGGKARFVVTPKNRERTSVAGALVSNIGELTFAGGLVAVALITVHTPLPVLMAVVPGYLSVYLSLLANKDPAGRPGFSPRTVAFRNRMRERLNRDLTARTWH